MTTFKLTLGLTISFLLFIEPAHAVKPGDHVLVRAQDGEIAAVVLKSSIDLGVTSSTEVLVQYEDMSTETVPSSRIEEIPSQAEIDGTYAEFLSRLSQKRTNQLLVQAPTLLFRTCITDSSDELKRVAKYLIEFTKAYCAKEVNKHQPSSKPVVDDTCVICFDAFNDPRIDGSVDVSRMDRASCFSGLKALLKRERLEAHNDGIQLSCGHSFHQNCLHRTMQLSFDRENAHELIACPETGCCAKLTPVELASLTKDSEQAIKIQKLLIRSVSNLKFCPHCGNGISKYSSEEGFIDHCFGCGQVLCFDCGKPGDVHQGFTCAELNSDKGVQEALIQDILRSGQDHLFGLCPYCELLVEKQGGCDWVTCGQNASDKQQIKFKGELASGKGCGNKFMWEFRIPLTELSESELEPESQPHTEHQPNQPATQAQDSQQSHSIWTRALNIPEGYLQAQQQITPGMTQTAAQDRIQVLIGNFVALQAEAFSKHISKDEGRVLQEVQTFEMQENRVTQGQYEALFGKDAMKSLKKYLRKNLRISRNEVRRLLGKDKPLLGLSIDRVENYRRELNLQLRALWAIAYPDQSFKELIIPADLQLQLDYQHSDAGIRFVR